jgi:hypothetical protein
VRPLTWIGQRSYGIYLWHWPVIDLLTPARTGLSGRTLIAVQIAITLAAATASFALVEQPIRGGALRGWRGLVAAPATALGLTLVVLVSTTAPAAQAASGVRPEPVDTVQVLPTTVPVMTPGPTSTSTLAPSPTAPSAPPGTASLIGHRIPTPQDPLRVLIVGDSVMYDATPGIAAALTATGVVTVTPATVFGLGLSTPRSVYDWAAHWAQWVSTDHPDLVIGGWDVAAAHSHGQDWYRALVDRADAVLGSGGAAVAFLEYPQNRPPTIPGQPTPDEQAREAGRQVVNRVFAAEADDHPQTVGFIPTASVLENHGTYAAYLPAADGGLVRVRKRDNVHFCPAGSERLGADIVSALQAPMALPKPDPSWRLGPWRADPRYDRPVGTCAP